MKYWVVGNLYGGSIVTINGGRLCHGESDVMHKMR